MEKVVCHGEVISFVWWIFPKRQKQVCRNKYPFAGCIQNFKKNVISSAPVIRSELFLIRRDNRSACRKKKTCWKVENELTQPTYDNKCRNQTGATLVKRECAHSAANLSSTGGMCFPTKYLILCESKPKANPTLAKFSGADGRSSFLTSPDLFSWTLIGSSRWLHLTG